MVLGFSAFAAASLLGTQLTHDWARGDFVTIVLLLSIGQALTLLPAIIALLSNSDPARATAFAAYIQVTRLGGAEIGIAVMGTWLRVREQVHSYYLGLHVENGSADVTQVLKGFSNRFAGDDAGSAAARAVDLLASLVQREANVLAYIDGFWLCFWFALAGLVVVACMTRAPAGPFTPEPFKFAKLVLRRCGIRLSA